MSLINIALSSKKLDEISKQLTSLTQKVNVMSATQEQLAAELQALASQQALDSANLTEALNELSGFPAQVAALQASVDKLTAELAAAGTASISPALVDAINAVVSGMVPVTAASAQLAAIVPNPV